MSSTLILVTLALDAEAELPDLRAQARRLGASLAALQGEALPPLIDALTAATTTGGEGADGTCEESSVHLRLLPVATDPARAAGASWVRRVAAHHLRCLPAERRGRIRVETTGVVDLGALTPESPARLPWRAVTGEEAPLRSPAWERPPRHARHVLVCRGPRCNAQGAAEVAARCCA